MSYILFNSENTINLENIIIGDAVNLNNNSKYYLYYLDSKPKEIYMQLPSIRLIYNYKNSKFNQIKFPIYPIWEKNKNFIKTIKSIEKLIKREIKIDKIFVSCLEKKDNITSLKLELNNTLLNDLKNYNINSEIEGKINISYIWENETKYGLTIMFKQLKNILNIDESNVNFYDKPIIKIPEQIIYKKVEKPSLLLSSNILLDALSKLKRT